MRGQHDPDHGSVCTSTDSTGGQVADDGATSVSPRVGASAYTWPPVVPK